MVLEYVGIELKILFQLVHPLYFRENPKKSQQLGLFRVLPKLGNLSLMNTRTVSLAIEHIYDYIKLHRVVM